ncbi:MAG: glycosyltransferase [Minisyncoccia bacterium]
MKVLSISTDRRLFEEKSAVLERQNGYTSKMEELHIIVFSYMSHSLTPKKIGNVFLYPTNSLSRATYFFDALKIGENIILKNGFNKTSSVITTQDPFETGLVGYFLHKKSNIPFQLQIHTDFLDPYFKRGFINRARVLIAKFVIPKAQGIRVVSSVISDSIKRKFPKLKIVPDVLPIFVDVNKLLTPSVSTKVEFPQFKFIIFMASRLTKEKRIYTALGALKEVLTEFPKVGLVIAGSGPEMDHLFNKVERLGMSKNVVFTGWQEDLLSYYKTADLFLLTSEYEGYGMTLIEAGASGCPIVTTRVGIAKTYMFKNGENCFVCPVGDSECLSRSILELIHDNSKRELFKRKMQYSIKSISITKEEYTTKYVALLEKLLQK